MELMVPGDERIGRLDRHDIGPRVGIGAKADPSALRYRDLLIIRRAEEAIGQLYALGHIRRTVQLSIGREAVFAGLADGRCAQDTIVIGGRCHGLLLALGLPAATLLRELAHSDVGLHAGTPDREVARFCRAKRIRLLDATAHDVLRAGLTMSAQPQRGKGEDCVTFVVLDCVGVPPSQIDSTIGELANMQEPIVVVLDIANPDPGPEDKCSTTWLAPFEHAGLMVRPIEGFDRDLVAAAIETARNATTTTKLPAILAISTEAFRGHAFATFHGNADPGTRRSGFDPVARVRARAITSHLAGDDTAAAIEAEVRAELAQATKAIRDRDQENDRTHSAD